MEPNRLSYTSTKEIWIEDANPIFAKPTKNINYHIVNNNLNISVASDLSIPSQS